jgi:hypothetical protein
MKITLEGRYLVGILIVGLVLRVLTGIVLEAQPESDYAGYQAMALNFIDGKGIIDTENNRAFLSVGYPLFILIPIFSLFSKSLLAAEVANSALGVVSIILCHKIAKEAGAGQIGRLLAALTLTLYLPSWVYAGYLAKENLMTPLMLGILWCGLRLAKKQSLSVAAICGGLFGLMAMTGTSALSLVATTLCGLVFTPANIRRKLTMVAIIIATAIVVTAPWIGRNYQILGSPVINTNGGFNLYLGNNPAANGYFVSIADTPAAPKWKALLKVGEVHASNSLREDAISWIKEHPTEFVILSFKKAALFWMPPIHNGKDQGSLKETVIRMMWLLQFIVLVLGAIGTILFPRLRTRYIAIVWLGIVSYTSIHMLFYVIFRYREPVMPFLCILTGLTLEHVWIYFKNLKQNAEINHYARAAINQ